MAVHFGLLVLRDREVAWNSDLFALFLEEAPETSVVDAVTLDDWNGRGLAVPYPDGRVVLGDMSEGRALEGQGLVFVPIFHELLVATCTDGLPDHWVADASQADLLFQHERIEGGLSTHGDGTANAGRLAEDRVLALGVGHVVVVGEPHARRGPGRTTCHRDAFGVEVPLLGLGPQKLYGPGGIMDCGGEQFDAGQPVVNRCITVSILELAWRSRFVLLSSEPAAAMDMDEQGSGFLGIDLPEVKNHVLVRPIGNVLVGRLDLLAEKRREKKKEKNRDKGFAEHVFFIFSNHCLGKLFLAFGMRLRIHG